ncbi:hypothetical protein EDD92_9307 [Streptomyces sp. TLI_185]|nr:hypothetical protein EDD92_9307 [Streptomyces sp. TLI_185]
MGDDTPFVVGRLLGIAGHLVARRSVRGGQAQCERLVDKLMRGGAPVAPVSLSQLRGLLEKDLADRSNPASTATRIKR